jgi:hypothetical protein
MKGPATPTGKFSFPPLKKKSIGVNDLEWSDEEDDTEEKRIQKYKLPVIKSVIDKEKTNKLLIERQEMVDEPSVTSPDRLFDHTRSFFRGEIKIKANVESYQNKQFQEQKFLFQSSSKQKIFSSLPTFPSITKELQNSFDVSFLNELWKECLKINAESSLALIPVTKKILVVLEWIDKSTNKHFSPAVSRDILKSYEINDFIPFEDFLQILIPYYRKEPLNKQEKENESLNATPITMVPIHCCTHSSCQICTRFSTVPVGQRHVKTIKKKNDHEEEESEEIQQPEEEENQEDKEEEEEEEEEDNFFTKEEKYRIESIYRQWLYSKQGKLRKKEIIQMIKECLIPIDKKKIPADFWNLSSELYFNGIEEFIALIKVFRKEKEINLKEVEMNKILKYSLPTWLKLEFKISEILLYQHLFSLIDIDQGGSIDAKELQSLFSAIGSNITAQEVRIIIFLVVFG